MRIMIDVGSIVSNFIEGVKLWIQTNAFPLFMKILPYLLVVLGLILAYSVWYMIQKYE